MTLKQLIERAAHKPGTSGAWRVEHEHTDDGVNLAHLYHYSTRMLTWRIISPLDSEYLSWSLGWGSVSDQNGMNTAFKVLGLPYYYSRRGGAEIVSLHVADECKSLPTYTRRSPELHLGEERGSIVRGHEESPLDRICREANEHIDYVLAHPSEFTEDEVARAQLSAYQRERLSIASTLRYED